MNRRPIYQTTTSAIKTYPSDSEHLPKRPSGRILKYPCRTNIGYPPHNELDVTKFEHRKGFMRALSKHVRNHNQHHLWQFYRSEFDAINGLRQEEKTLKEREEYFFVQEEVAFSIADRLNRSPNSVLRGKMSWDAFDYVLSLFDIKAKHNTPENFNKSFGIKITSPELMGDIVYEDAKTVGYVLWKRNNTPEKKYPTPKESYSAQRVTDWMKAFGGRKDHAIVDQLHNNPYAAPTGIIEADSLENALAELGIKSSDKVTILDDDRIIGYNIEHELYCGDVRYADDFSKVAYTIWKKGTAISSCPRPRFVEKQIPLDERLVRRRKNWIADADSRLVLQFQAHPDKIDTGSALDNAYDQIEDVKGLGYSHPDILTAHTLQNRFEEIIKEFIIDSRPKRPKQDYVKSKKLSFTQKVSRTPITFRSEPVTETPYTPHRKEGRGKKAKRKKQSNKIKITDSDRKRRAKRRVGKEKFRRDNQQSR